jgi:hypothetical protein
MIRASTTTGGMISLPASDISFSLLRFPVLSLTKESDFYNYFFCFEIQLWFLKIEIFLKFELEKFWFLQTEFFIKRKIGFLEGKKESCGDWKKNFHEI